MPSLRTQTQTLPPVAQRSDENWVFTAVAVFLVASVVVLGAGYQYLKYSKQQEQSRQERQTYERYNDYLHAQDPAPVVKTAPADPASAEPPAQAASPAEPSMAQKLLSHPAVTPGPGFGAPGVQQTGVTIIDAIDHAQSTSRQR